eukprot:788120-Prorocentrum_lima.AAC.1
MPPPHHPRVKSAVVDVACYSIPPSVSSYAKEQQPNPYSSRMAHKFPITDSGKELRHRMAQ